MNINNDFDFPMKTVAFSFARFAALRETNKTLKYSTLKKREYN